jgi:hypothetical protein
MALSLEARHDEKLADSPSLSIEFHEEIVASNESNESESLSNTLDHSDR